jgi:hypothetical protein
MRSFHERNLIARIKFNQLHIDRISKGYVQEKDSQRDTIAHASDAMHLYKFSMK